MQATTSGQYDNSVYWGINPPSSKTPPPLSCQPPPIKSTNCPTPPPFLGNPPPYILVFREISPLKIGFFSKPQKY